MHLLKVPSPRLLIATALLSAALPASAEIVDIQFGDSRRIAHDIKVPAGKIAEACGRMAVGSTVQWRFSSSVALDFNIHYHEGSKVVYPVKQDGTAASDGDLEVVVGEAYCWMWTNRSSGATSVRLELSR